MAGQQIQDGYSDEKFEVLNNDFVNEGYDFVCWNTKPDGTGTNIYPNELIDVQNDITLYAQWKLAYTYMQLVHVGGVSVKANTATFGINAGLRTPTFFGMTDENCFELMLKFTTSDDVTTKQNIFRQSASYEYGLYLEDRTLVYMLTGATSNVNIQPNTTYYMKVVKNCALLDVYLSTDNITFAKVLSTKSSFNAVNQYFVFGQQIDYDKVVESTEDKPVTKYRYPAYYTNDGIHWVTKEQSCQYGDRDKKTFSYSTKLLHATQYAAIKNSSMPDGIDVSKINWKGPLKNGCGEWRNDYPVYHPPTGEYEEIEKITIQTIVPTTYRSFSGIMDFNESYFILNNFKNKLKA